MDLNPLELLLPRAVVWVKAEAARAIRDGVPLSPAEIAIAQRCGVESPECVRLLRVDSMPQPDDLILQTTARNFDFSLSNAHGLTLNAGIFILHQAWRDEALIAHELVHVAQYERMGIEGFLRRYLGEVMTVGYDQSPLEIEAIEVSRVALW